MTQRKTSPPDEPESSTGGCRTLLMLAAAGVLFLLTACSNAPPPIESEDGRFEYVRSIRVTPSDTVQEIEQLHGATVVSWHPEAKFAVLGIDSETANPRSLSTADNNQDVMTSPEVTAEGLSLWAGGISAWAGGISLWAGGISAWAGGTTEENPFPGNEDDWSAMKLAEAQEIAPNFGQDIKVAVIDTGLDLAHEAFTGKLAPLLEWRDFVDGDSIPQDEKEEEEEDGGAAYGHGTAVAGIVLQVAPNATILPLRVLRSDGYGDVTDVVAAIDWAVQKGASVINLSLGSEVEIEALLDMINYAQSQGIPVISSSGNSGDTAVTFPAVKSLDRITGGRPIGVGSTDADDAKSSFSTYGSNLEMLAPGNAIATLYPANQLAHATGTSFAAPWVTGTLALMLGELKGNGNASAAVTQTAANVDSNNSGLEGMLGYGRLDAKEALRKWLGIR